MEIESLDSLTKETLSSKAYELIPKKEEQTIFNMLIGVFKAEMKWIAVYFGLLAAISAGCCINFTFRIFQTTDKLMSRGFFYISADQLAQAPESA